MRRKIAAGIAAVALAAGGLVWASPAMADDEVPPSEAVVQVEATPAEEPVEVVEPEAVVEEVVEVVEEPADQDVVTPQTQPTPTPTSSEPPKDHKWYVCKYVGTPGVDERLQTGNNPIFVDEHSIEVSPVFIGATFSDAHTHSIVIAGPYEKKIDPEPTVADCPPPAPDLVTPFLEFTPPTCEADGTLSMSGPESGVLWGAVGHEDGSVTYTASPAPGFAFPAGVQTVYTVPDLDQLPADSDECFVPEPDPTHLADPTFEDPCGTDNDFANLPEDTASVDYEWASEDPENLDIVAVIAEGFFVETAPEGWSEQEDGTWLFVWTYEFNDDECVLFPGDIDAACVGDVPYLVYEVIPEEGTVVEGDNPVTITFDDGTNFFTLPGTYPLSGSVLWPGASDADPQQWPGWALIDGEYVNVGDENFGWTRDGVTVTFEVNPEFSTVVEYPEATAECANPPADTPPAPPTPGLASTGGGDVSPMLPIGAGLASALGVALFLTDRLRRRA